jgi:hypothetical protein
VLSGITGGGFGERGRRDVPIKQGKEGRVTQRCGRGIESIGVAAFSIEIVVYTYYQRLMEGVLLGYL